MTTAPDTNQSPATDLALVPRGWLDQRANEQRKLRIGAAVLGVLAAFMATMTFVNKEVEHSLPTAAILAGFALLSWAVSGARTNAKKAPRLANAVDFTDASTRPADSWVHFCALRSVRWPMLFASIGVGLAAAAFAAVCFIFPAKYAPEDGRIFSQLLVWGVGLLSAGLAFLFLWAAVMSYRTQRANGGWPRRYGITLGESGIALYTAADDREIEWAAIVNVEATILFNGGDKKHALPAIKISWAATDGSGRRKLSHPTFMNDSLDVSPHMLFTALNFYLRTPDARAELGTTVAQRRLEGWAAAAR